MIYFDFVAERRLVSSEIVWIWRLLVQEPWPKYLAVAVAVIVSAGITNRNLERPDPAA